MAVWSVISKVKHQCQKILDDANLPLGIKTLAALGTFPDGDYTYQHPIKKSLKTHNINEGWVQFYIGKDKTNNNRFGGVTGSLEDLESTAIKSKSRAWIRATKKKKKIAAYSGITVDMKDGTDGKKSASKGVGVG